MCDSLVAMKESTSDGYTIFGKVSDRAVNEPQYFTFVPAADHKSDEKIRCTFIEIDQACHTNAMILSKPSWIWGAEIGVNEYGLCIGNESVYSKEPQGKPALIGMDLVRIGLERANTAKEAVDKMTEALERYGQGGNCSFDAEYYYDNSFLIVDATQGWVLETAGRYWVAKQVRKVHSISNYMSIAKPDILCKSAVTHAREAGYKISEPFDFTRAFINWKHPGNHNGMVRKLSGQRLLDECDEKVTVKDMIRTLQSHTTDSPFTEGNFSICKHSIGQAGLHQATNSMIVQLRDNEILIWGAGMSLPCISLYKPFWFDAYSDKVVFPYDRQEEAMDAWLKREKLNRAIVDGRINESLYKLELEELQESLFRKIQIIAKEDRRRFCDSTAKEEEEFVNRWLVMAENAIPNPLGDKEFQMHWARYNSQLGRNRTIVY